MAETWTVRGRIVVRHRLQPLIDNLGATSPLAGVQVRVAARKRVAGVWGNWGPAWGTVITNQSGEFVIRRRKDRLPRRFQVVARLRSGPLTVFGANKNLISRALAAFAIGGLNPGAAALEALLAHTGRVTLKAARHRVHRDDSGVTRSHGDIDLGTIVMDGGDARTHGDIWVLAQRLMMQLHQWGFAFRTRVGIKYPHHNHLIGAASPGATEAPYTNPFNHVVYMVRNNTTDWMDPGMDPVQTLLHELMHVWAFARSQGEVGMAWQLLLHGDTHRPQQEPFVSFHEGFAEWAATWLRTVILPTNAPPRLEPQARPTLQALGLNTFDQVDRNEVGWASVFATLSEPDLDRMDFNAADPDGSAPVAFPKTCNYPNPSFTAILQSFQPGPRVDHPLRKREMNLRAYLRRLDALNRIRDGSVQQWAQLIDPAGTRNPVDLLCP